jgi:hypothetical protein
VAGGGAALLAILGQLGLLPVSAAASLAAYATPVITNTRGEPVGSVRAKLALVVS